MKLGKRDSSKQTDDPVGQMNRVTDDGHEKRLGFRTHKRSWRENFRFQIKRGLGKPSLLGLIPVVIVFLGALVAMGISGGSIAAGVAVIVTGALCILSVYVSNAFVGAKRHLDKNTINRFEKLEDKAWELQESEERYRAIAGVFGDALVMRDETGAITYCNDAFKILAEEDFGPLKPDSKFPDALLDQLGTHDKKTGAIEVEFLSNRQSRWFEWHDLSVRDEKTGGMGVLSIARDITAFRHTRQLDEQARKKAEEASKAKSRFLAMVSHEMRTPLNGIIGMSKLLSATRLSLEQKNYSAAVLTSGENLLGLIDGMLDLTMIEAGHFEVKPQRFNLTDLLNNAVELLSHRAYAKGIDCGLFIDPSLPENIKTDPGRLRQILFNLAGNAVKFTNSGGVLIRCLLAENDQMPILRIEVIDTGSGLSVADREKIFEEFERADNEITRTSDGAGLGLAISRALAKEMGGTLELEKSDHTGSQFVFEMPFNLETSDQRQTSCQDGEDGFAAGKAFLILSQMKQEPKALSETLMAEGAQTVQIMTEKELSPHTIRNLKKFAAVFFDPTHWQKPEETIAILKGKMAKDAILIVLSVADKKYEFENYQNSGADAWLIRPIRKISLMSLLQAGKMALQKGEADKTEKQVSKSVPSMASSVGAEIFPHGHVLLAEDNDINALLVTAALQKRNIRVTRAMDGNDALAKFVLNGEKDIAEKFSVILMDMHMPQCDGFSATAAIRKYEDENFESSSKKAKIFALTADEQNQSKKKAEAAGVDGFLVKPIDPVKLCELVERELEKQPKHDRLRA